jgi:hypothetical protein
MPHPLSPSPHLRSLIKHTHHGYQSLSYIQKNTNPSPPSPHSKPALKQRPNNPHRSIPPRLLHRHEIRIQIDAPPSTIDIHDARGNVHGPVSAVKFPEDVERENDRRGEVVCEEVLGGYAGGCATDGLLCLLLAFFSSLPPKV